MVYLDLYCKTKRTSILTTQKKYQIATIFGFQELDNEEKLRRVILVRVILLTNLFGIIWSIIYFILGLYSGGFVVAGYSVLTVVNLLIYYISKKYEPFRMTQLILILLLPTATQIALGGFYAASNVILSSIVSPLGALMFYNIRTARVLFILFLVSVVFITIFEFVFPFKAENVDRHVVLLFFAMNTLVISSIVFALLVYFVGQRAMFQKMLAEKNKDLTDSIQYAKRIQDAILPSIKYMKTEFPDSFILYKPKDIVAGDFYFFETFDDYAFVAAADCTGHGVPGAMVSVVCSNALLRVIKEFQVTDPGLILDKVRELVIETFSHNEKQEGAKEEFVKDGMDISLAVLNTRTRELKWAGANNCLLLFKKRSEENTLSGGSSKIHSFSSTENTAIEDMEMIEFMADKQPIGNYALQNNFTTHNIQLQKDDCLYLYTDGYEDQFGGEKGKKFKAANIRKMLLSLYHKPMDQQCLRIDEMFKQWRGDLEQIDDVCFIGIRI